jgi:hypothetical protein
MYCKICGSISKYIFKAKILNKYSIGYYQCRNCGFIQTEEPYWLEEAYKNSISVSDTGLVQRNISVAAKLAALIYFELGHKHAYLDIAGGYGMLTRLMRDIGFDFYWSDKYCQNLLSRGFESENANAPFYALTALEVLEHVRDPHEFIRDNFRYFNTRTLIFTTELYQGHIPPKDWDYYSFSTGQHISFYQTKTLQRIADKIRLKFYSAHGFHIFTDQSINKWRFNILTSRLAYPIAFYVKLRMKSRTMTDHYMLINTDKKSIKAD